MILTSLFFCSGCLLAAAKLPHILIVVADDIGWSNIGYNNKDMLTPVMDELAADGVILTRQYTYKFCSPTRSSVLSGRLPIHVNEGNDPTTAPGAGIPVGMTLIPEKLKTVGYSTHFLGKWHNGMATPQHIPVGRGFDTGLGYFEWGEDHFTQERMNKECPSGGQMDLWENDGPSAKNGTYGGYLYSGEAVNILHKHDPNTPFFMYLAFQNNHDPYEVPSHYSDRFPTDWFKNRRQYNGMTLAMDEGLGNVTSVLREKGMWEDTLLIFTSDNGGMVDYQPNYHGQGELFGSGNNWPLRGGKFGNFEGGVRTVAFLSGGMVPSHIRGTVNSQYIHIADWYSVICHLTALDPEDDRAAALGLPPVDSINIWEHLVGAASSPWPRTEIPLAGSQDAALIVGDYKIMFGMNRVNFWQGPNYPNGTSPTANPELDCGDSGCLFNIIADPTEQVDLSTSLPEVLAALQTRWEEIKPSIYRPPAASLEPDPAACVQKDKYGGWYGPWLNLTTAK